MSLSRFSISKATQQLIVAGCLIGLAACDSGEKRMPANADAPNASASGENATAPTARGPSTKHVAASLNDAVLGSWRSEGYLASDPHRNPEKTLEFFGLTPSSVAVEIEPGTGYYAEILAPLLAQSGSYAVVVPQGAAIRGEITNRPEVYHKAEVRSYGAGASTFAPVGSVDVVLVFSGVDTWVREKRAEAMFKAAYDALKPGGVLGVVQYRDNATDTHDGSSGYLSEKQVVFQAELAGFSLVEWSELNSNPKDTREHTGGARALAPTFVNGDADRDRLAAIGEPDRMTLKFVKRK